MSVWDGLDEDMSRTDLAEEIQRLRGELSASRARERASADYAQQLTEAGDALARRAWDVAGPAVDTQLDAWRGAVRGEWES